MTSLWYQLMSTDLPLEHVEGLVHYIDVIMGATVSNHQSHDCLLNRVFGHRWNKTSKLRVTGLSVGNIPVTGEFPAQMASNAENGSNSWRHHIKIYMNLTLIGRHHIQKDKEYTLNEAWSVKYIKASTKCVNTCQKSWIALQTFVRSNHYIDVIMTTVASQITSLTVVYSIVYSGADQRKHQSSASLAFVRGLPRTKGR